MQIQTGQMVDQTQIKTVLGQITPQMETQTQHPLVAAVQTQPFLVATIQTQRFLAAALPEFQAMRRALEFYVQTNRVRLLTILPTRELEKQLQI